MIMAINTDTDTDTDTDIEESNVFLDETNIRANFNEGIKYKNGQFGWKGVDLKRLKLWERPLNL